MTPPPFASRDARQAALLYAVIALIFVLVEWVIPGGLPHPIRPDDYSAVSGVLSDLSLHWKRPVSSNVILLLGSIGPVAVYLALALLAVVDALLVLLLVSRVFGVRPGVPLAVVFGVMLSTHVSAYYHATYLGLLTNLTSHFFGLLAMCALLRGWRLGHAAWLVAAVVAYFLTAMAKEDVLLPPLVLALWLAIEPRPVDCLPATRRVSCARWAVAAAMLAVAVGSMWWSAHDRNPFVAGLLSPGHSSAAYAVDLSPLTLARAFWTLLVGFAPAVAAAAGVSLAVIWWLRPDARLRVLWFSATTATLVVPYALISNSMSVFRTYAWLPWLCAIVVVALCAVAQRVDAAAAIDMAKDPRAVRTTRITRGNVIALAIGALLALGVAWTHQHARAAAAADYTRQAALNRRVVDTLLAARPAIDGAAAVGLVGLGDGSPWCAQDALYVNRKLGFAPTRWIIFVPAPSRCYTQQVRNVQRRQGVNVSVVALDTLCAQGALPVLAYTPDGSGRVRRADDFCTPAGVRRPSREPADPRRTSDGV